MFKIKIFTLILLSILICIDTKAQEEIELGKIIVTATKTETPQAYIGSSHTVVTSKEIKQTGKTTVLEVLRTVPGITVSQTGSFGGLTNIYLRGSKPGHILVMIDGVEVNDPMSFDRSFNFAHLTVDNIDRIEIVRGPQSTLYGSDAMGGVINIITKKGEGRPKFEFTPEVGSHNTFKGLINLSGGSEKIDYSLSLSRLDSDGISKAFGGLEKDAYGNTIFSSRFGYKIFGDTKLNFYLYFIDTETDIDDGSYEDDPNYTEWKKMLASKLEFLQKLKLWWNHKLSFTYSDTRRKYRDERDNIDTNEDIQGWYKGDNKKFEWQNNFIPFDWNIITLGFEYEEERGSSYYRSGTRVSKIDRKIVDNQGYYLQNQLKLWDSLFITPGLRIDDHELFGSHTTYKISGAYLIKETKTRLKANWGTGFKAPSLFQLYSRWGDPNLKPDESKGFDFGFEQDLFDNKFSFGLTYFYNDFKNMVAWDPATWRYRNIERTETKGFELETKFLPLKNFIIGANFTYTDTKDKVTGLQLLRRPKRQTNFDFNWQFLENANLNLRLNYVGKREDMDYIVWPPKRITMKDYTKIDLFCSYDLTKNFQLFGRLENMFDKRYQDIYGYAMPGRSFYIGVKVNF